MPEARPAPLPLALLAGLAAATPGCDFYADDDDFVADDDTAPGDDDAVGEAPDCSEEVLLPASTLLLEPTEVADRHEEVYGASPAPFQVVLGWPSRDPSRSASFVWRTDLDTRASRVQWGIGDGLAADALAEGAEGYTFTYAGTDGDVRIHEVRLCGRLEPSTAYSYRVGGEGAWSPIHSFTTPGAPGSFDTFKVALAGDSRGAYSTWGALVAAMESHAPDFYLFSGDMVELGLDQGEWDAWFAATGDVLSRKAFVPAVGNHEFLAANYFAQFSMPGRELWFSIDFGTLHVTSLADMNLDEGTLFGEEANFLDQDLASTDLPFKMAMHHFPAYSTCTTHGSNETVRSAWVPTFERHGVDLVLSGHNHIYERSVPVRDGGEVPTGEGTVYLVSGGAGAPLYENVDDGLWFGSVANPIEHYVIAEFSPGEVVFTAYDLSGTTIDRFTLPI